MFCTRRLCLTALSLSLFGLFAHGSMAAEGKAVLKWPGKGSDARTMPAPAPELPQLSKALPNTASGQPGFDIPPSPYGQVGDPYRRELNWPGKDAPRPAPAPVQKPAQGNLASNWTPSPQNASRFDQPLPDTHPAPQPVTPAPVVREPPKPTPMPAPVQTAKRPVTEALPQDKFNAPAPMPAPKPTLETAQKPVIKTDAPKLAETPKPAPTVPVAPQTEKKAESKPAPVVAVAPPVTKSAQAPTPAPVPTDNGYRLPANSKYAGKVSPELEGKATPKPVTTPLSVAAVAKAAEPKADTKKADTQKVGTKPAAGPETTRAEVKLATAPASDAPLAQAAEQESAEPYTPFVPGSRATSADQAPRFYSLHRAYGYEPDPAPHSGGNLSLDANAVETKDAQVKDTQTQSPQTKNAANKTDATKTESATPAKDKTS